MDVRLCRAGDGNAVEGESGRLSLVYVSLGTCSCPDHQQDEVDRCKHLRRVDMELAMGTVPTPDGRLPDPRRPVADGGVDTADDGRYNAGSNGRIDGPLREFDKYGELKRWKRHVGCRSSDSGRGRHATQHISPKSRHSWVSRREISTSKPQPSQ